MLKKIIFTVAVLVAATACKDNEVDAGHSYALLKKEVPGVYDNENNLFVYDNDIYQLAFNTRHRSFRIQNTSQSRYISCTLDAEPVVDKYVSVTVETHGISSFPSQEMQALVLKRDQGKVWLWNAETKIGLILRLE
ncbi:hypothetical protein [uncultured Alistipes sp.]|uniref:hypothetical protein n=1 Tax=uncultured Alistipes sp. TaxID=538949 RepID=UPI0025E2EBF1|nr:hypothetical protein [uncultured Alistipes sp.]